MTSENYIPRGSIPVERLKRILDSIGTHKYFTPQSREALAKAVIFVSGNGDDVRRAMRRYMRGTKGFKPTEISKSSWLALQKSLKQDLKDGKSTPE